MRSGTPGVSSGTEHGKGNDVKMRKGWRVIWSDGTEWDGDCPRWAAAPVTPGARVVPIRIVGERRYDCPGCKTGRH